MSFLNESTASHARKVSTEQAILFDTKNRHKEFNRFEDDHEDQQLIAKNDEALEKLEENNLHSPHLIGQFIESEFTAPALTSGYHTARKSGDASTDGSGFFDVEDSQMHPSSRFSNSSQVPPPVSYCTDGQAGDTSINESGFFDLEDFHQHSQILLSESITSAGKPVIHLQGEVDSST